MSPHYLVKVEMLTAYKLSLGCYRRKVQNLCHCNCGLQIRQIWIQLITACGKYRRRKWTKN